MWLMEFTKHCAREKDNIALSEDKAFTLINTVI